MQQISDLRGGPNFVAFGLVYRGDLLPPMQQNLDLRGDPNFVALGAVNRRDLLRRMQQNSDLRGGPNFVALDKSKAYRNQVIYLRWNSKAMAAQRSAT